MVRDLHEHAPESHLYEKLLEDLQPIVGKVKQDKSKKIVSVQDVEASKHYKISNVKVDFDEIIHDSKIEKSSLKISKKLKPVELILSKAVVARREKKKNFKDLTQHMNEWQNVIEENRNVRCNDYQNQRKSLKFPLDRADVSEPSLIDWIKDDDEPENACAGIKDESLLGVIREMTPHQRNILNKLQLLESISRRSHLARLHTFLHQYGKERNRVKKIKSKNYRKNAKKEEKKQLQNINIEDMKSHQPELFEKQLQQVEKLRAEERARLKHRGGSKWRRNLLLKGSTNPDIRDALIEQHRINQKLTVDNKIDHESEESDSQPEDDMKIEQNVAEILTNSWFNDNSKELNILKEAISSARYIKPTKISPKVKKLRKNELSDDDIDIYEQINKISDLENIKNHIELSATHDNIDLHEINDQVLDDLNFHSYLGETYMNDVSEAFADDQAIEQFVEENKPTEEGTDDQAAMFGWGKWVNPVELRRPKPPKRKAENYLSTENPHVIFNIPEKDEIQKHLVSFVPYKFSDKKQFEEHINQPIGREWNTAYKFRAKIAPRIQTNPGIAILPLDSRTMSNPETEKLKKLASGLPLKIREALLSKIL